MAALVRRALVEVGTVPVLPSRKYISLGREAKLRISASVTLISPTLIYFLILVSAYLEDKNMEKNNG